MSISDHAPKQKPQTKWIAGRAPVELRKQLEKALKKRGLTWQDFIIMSAKEFLIENKGSK